MEETKKFPRFDPLGWARRHKKRTALILVLVLAAALVLRGFLFRSAPTSSYQFVRTTTLQKSSLTDSVSVSGTVKSGSEVSVTVADSAKNYKVSEVRVTVGDKVKKGDVIAVLDTQDLQEQITSARQNYADSVQSAQTSYDRAVQDLNTSTVQHENNLIDLRDKIKQADEDLDGAKGDLEDAEDNEDDAEDAYDDAKAKYDKIKAAYDSAAASISSYTEAKEKAADALSEAQKALNDAQSALNEDPDNAEKKQAVTDAQEKIGDGQSSGLLKDYNDAETNLTNAKNNCSVTELGLYGFNSIASALSDAENSREQAKTAYENAQKAVDSAQKAVDNARQQVQSAHNSYDQEKNYSSLTNKVQNVEDSATKLEQTSRTPDSLKDLQGTLDECTLKATMDGTITGLNATVGSVCSGTVATIQNTSALVVEVTIPASSVSKLSTGMACRITSDATGDHEIEGTLTQIDPVANDQGTFGAKVTVSGEDTGLLIGISAKVEIVISEKQGVFSVPRDAVGTAEDGSSYVLSKTGGEGVNSTFEEVTVTTGEGNDYYIEISGEELSEGDVIRSSADLTQGIETAGESEADAMQQADAVPMQQADAVVGGSGGNAGGPGGGAPGGGGPGGM